MATAKGKRTPATTTKKKAPAKKSAASSRSRKSAARRRQASGTTPVLGLLLLGIGIFLFYCLVSPANTVLIVAVRGFMNGTFGKLSPVAAILTAFGGLQMGFGDRWPAPRVFWVQCALMLFAIMTLLQVFVTDDILRALRTEGYLENYNGFLWKSHNASRNVPVGGGAAGALLAYPMDAMLDMLGSVLVLFLVIFGLLFWMIRTMMPSAGERLGEWFAELRDSYAIRREEREAEKEAERIAWEEEQANAALLVPLPEDLMEYEEEYVEEAPPTKRVATGRKKPKPQAAPAPAPAQPPRQRPQPQPQQRPQPQKQRPAPPPPPVEQPMWDMQPGPEEWAAEAYEQTYMQPEMEWPQNPQPAPPRKRPAPAKNAPARNGGKRPKLYIENETTPGRVPPMESAYTEYDAERAKYATRPSRKDDEAIPDFILKRRQQLDAEYAAISRIRHPKPEPEPVIEEPVAEAETDSAEYGFEMIGPDDAYYEETYDAPEPVPEPPAPKPHKGKPYIIENPLDKQPKLDPETRLDRPDWKPPVEEEPEEAPSFEEYRQPPFSLLLRDEKRMRQDTREADAQGAQKLEDTLKSFGVTARVMKVVHGPAITRYELQPAPGIKVSKIVGLTDDIALNMAAVGVRIEAPIPGKAAIGIEIANDEIHTVHLRDVLESDESMRNTSKLAVALGKDIAGKRIIADLARMPHLLIAGATGSGKSVCINTLITSIIYRATPEEVRMILIDPKKVELAVYNGIPHLLVPVVTDPKKASGALNWAVMEMDERYKVFAEIGVRDIKGYNAHRPDDAPLMPQIVVIIDELSDLMLVTPGEVEESICRLAQLARACGIHLVIATQRPSVNVITGIIKANIPSRIAFAVSSQVDSRTILDSAGAEKLLGKGDMLYAPSGGGKPLRVQGCFVSDDEVSRVVEFVKDRHTTDYSQAVLEALDTAEEAAAAASEEADAGECDPLFEQAVEMAIESGQTSISMLQRRLRVGYARAGRIVDEMSQRGIIGQADGAKPREVLMTREEFNAMYKR